MSRTSPIYKANNVISSVSPDFNRHFIEYTVETVWSQTLDSNE